MNINELLYLMVPRSRNKLAGRMVIVDILLKCRQSLSLKRGRLEAADLNKAHTSMFLNTGQWV